MGRSRCHAADRNGRDLSTDKQLGTLQQVQEIYGRGQTWRITGLWYGQLYFSGAIDWKIGRLTLGEDFASFPCDFQNLSFCGAPAGNIEGGYWFNWPVSQWGTRVKVNSAGDLSAQVGIYQVDPNYLATRYAGKLRSPPGTTGALIPLEIQYTPTPRGMAGSYKIGGWYNTSDSTDVYYDLNHQPRALTAQPGLQRNGAYGGYVLVEQQLTQTTPNSHSKRGLSIFFNATQADRNTSVIDSQFSLGLVHVGLFQQRPTDDIGLATARTHINSRVAAGERLQNADGLGPVPVGHSEYATELYYGWHAIGGLILRPNLQYVHYPGGTSQNPDVVIVGLKIITNL